MQKMRKDFRNFVGGRWEERNGQATDPVYDPTTGKVIVEIRSRVGRMWTRW